MPDGGPNAHKKSSWKLCLLSTFIYLGAFGEGHSDVVPRPQPHHDTRGLLTDSGLVWKSGNLLIRSLSLADEGDAVAYLMRVETPVRTEAGPGFQETLIELRVTEAMMGRIPPGMHITVQGRLETYEDGSLVLLVTEVFPASDVGQSATMQPTPGRHRGVLAAGEAADGVSTKVAAPESASSVGASSTAAWRQTRVVTDMSVLIMVAQICDYPAVVSDISLVEKIMFDGPGSYGSTLQGYYSECSRGKAILNRSNSRVVGPVVIPCAYNGTSIKFNTDSCTYANSDAWHNFAQLYAQAVLNVNVSQYRHRVLLLPRMFSSWTGCMWIGQGTLGPDRISSAGAYLSSKVWLSGEYWNQPMAYFHELGHTNFLHHAMQGGCPYCDHTSPMGACCAVRCFNAPHNWQLGWGTPLVTLSTQNFPAATWVSHHLPAQHTSDEHMILVQPDWSPSYSSGISYMWFISYRVSSGQYDQQLPGDYTYLTNIYWWNGGSQTIPIMTNWMAAVYNGEIFSNMTDMISIRQLSGDSNGAVVALCRMSQAVEQDCDDGLDNDCNGLIDDLDPACNAAREPASNVFFGSADRSYIPPPPHPIRPSHPLQPPPSAPLPPPTAPPTPPLRPSAPRKSPPPPRSPPPSPPGPPAPPKPVPPRKSPPPPLPSPRPSHPPKSPPPRTSTPSPSPPQSHPLPKTGLPLHLSHKSSRLLSTQAGLDDTAATPTRTMTQLMGETAAVDGAGLTQGVEAAGGVAQESLDWSATLPDGWEGDWGLVDPAANAGVGLGAGGAGLQSDVGPDLEQVLQEQLAGGGSADRDASSRGEVGGVPLGGSLAGAGGRTLIAGGSHEEAESRWGLEASKGQDVWRAREGEGGADEGQLGQGSQPGHTGQQASVPAPTEAAALLQRLRQSQRDRRRGIASTATATRDQRRRRPLVKWWQLQQAGGGVEERKQPEEVQEEVEQAAEAAREGGSL